MANANVSKATKVLAMVGVGLASALYAAQLLQVDIRLAFAGAQKPVAAAQENAPKMPQGLGAAADLAPPPNPPPQQPPPPQAAPLQWAVPDQKAIDTLAKENRELKERQQAEAKQKAEEDRKKAEEAENAKKKAEEEAKKKEAEEAKKKDAEEARRMAELGVYVRTRDYGKSKNSVAVTSIAFLKGTFNATYWRNGITTKKFDVPDYYKAAGGDKYTSGLERNENGKQVAVIKRNGTTMYPLTDGNFNAQVNHVFVSGSDIYAAGWESNADGKPVAKVWKNREPFQILTNGSYSAAANFVFVSDDGVYVAGHEVNERGHLIAKVWKNGRLFLTLSDGNKNEVADAVLVKVGS
jgi:hypothetical protein